MKSSSYLIEHQCPQCGAPAVLKETDHIFSCEYCRVNSCLMEKDYFRYLIPHSAPKDKEIIYFPYWRFKGMSYSALPEEINHRFVDGSMPATVSAYFPPSLGLRTQALKLRFLSPETPGRFIAPSLSSKDAIAHFEKRFSGSIREAIYLKAYIGEAVSMVYAPFYMDGAMTDAVLNKPLMPPNTREADPLLLPHKQPDWKIGFVPTICPNCGWDLSGERNTLALTCSNCDSVWKSGKTGLKRLSFARIPHKGDDIIYLPFWRIRGEVSGVILNSLADMVKLGNLPKVIQKGWEEIPFYFWTLAFKLPPRMFMRLSCNMTIAQPDEEFDKKVPKKGLFPVTLPVTEAVESLRILMAEFMKPKTTFLPRLERINIKPKKYLLVYVPFRESHHEYIHPFQKISVAKNMLNMAKNL